MPVKHGIGFKSLPSFEINEIKLNFIALFFQMSCSNGTLDNCFEWACQDFLLLNAKFRPSVLAASRHGTPSLTSLPKDDDVSSEVRPPSSPIRSLTSLDRA